MQFAHRTRTSVSLRLTCGEWDIWIAADSQEKRSHFETALMREGLAFRSASNHLLTFNIADIAPQDMCDGLLRRALETIEKAWVENGL